MGIYSKRVTGGNGISFTKETDSSADWPNIANNTYFRDIADGLIHYKNSTGSILEIFADNSVPQANIIYVDSSNGVNYATGRGGITSPYLTPEYALSNITNTGAITVTTTSTSATLTAVSDTTNISIGQYITGTGIPYDSIVISKTANTIVLSKTCTASATITATWWTIYELMLIGNFTVTSTIYKHGFIINADVYKATINFGAITLFRVLTQPLIPINILLFKTIGTSASSKLFDTSNLYLDGGDMYFYYGDYYSLGTDVQIGHGNRYPSFSGNVSFNGVRFDARFGRILVCSFSGYFSWKGKNSYGLLGGVNNYVGVQFDFDDNITTPVNINALTCSPTNLANIYGSINGSVTISGYKTNCYANITGTTLDLGGDGTSTYRHHNYYGDLIGTVNSYAYCNYYGFINGAFNSLGTLSDHVIRGGVKGTITCSVSTLSYNSEHTKYANDSLISVVVGAGNFTNNGVAIIISLTYTGTGTFTNNGKINCNVLANNPPSFVLSSGGTFINNGNIKCISECAAIFDKSASSTFINNGIMTNPLGMYIRYLTNSSPSRDLIIGNSICDGNLYAKPSAGCGSSNKFNVMVANTNTSVDIYDGVTTVTISVVGAGKSIAVISQEIVTLIKASTLRYQGVTYLSGYNAIIFVNVTGTTPTFINLVNINGVGVYNGGGGFSATVLASGTELASSYYSNF